MIFLMLFLFAGKLFADVPAHWNQMTEVRDRHEFYANNEMIVKPRESWQTLFSVVYTDVNLVQAKDCVFFKVPGDNLGILKVKTIKSDEICDKYLLSKGDKEWKDIKSLHFSTLPERLTLDMTFPQYQNEKWDLNFQNNFKRPEVKMHLSSSEFKGPKIILLAPSTQGIEGVSASLKDKTVCHDVNDECEIVKASTCSQCENGWYEIPNGCEIGPKYCGRVQCGLKNGPACRRGYKWQREEKVFDCRTDASFAFCAKGLEVHCQGRQAFCR